MIDALTLIAGALGAMTLWLLFFGTVLFITRKIDEHNDNR